MPLRMTCLKLCLFHSILWYLLCCGLYYIYSAILFNVLIYAVHWEITVMLRWAIWPMLNEHALCLSKWMRVWQCCEIAWTLEMRRVLAKYSRRLSSVVVYWKGFTFWSICEGCSRALSLIFPFESIAFDRELVCSPSGACCCIY